MFSQFQARYPMGSIVSELLQIHNGNYVVRVVVQVGGITLATGMAAAAEIDQAEDQARIRALTILGIYPSADQTQAYRIVDSETRLTSSSLGSESNFMFESESEAAVSNQTDIPADWHKEEDTQLPSLSLPSQLPDQLTGAPINASKRSNQTSKVATQSSKASSKNGLQPPAGDATQTQPTDLSDAIAQTSVELRRLNWSNAQGRNYLQQTYGKRSRQQLTDEELLDFLSYLQSQPSEDELSF